MHVQTSVKRQMLCEGLKNRVFCYKGYEVGARKKFGFPRSMIATRLFPHSCLSTATDNLLLNLGIQIENRTTFSSFSLLGSGQVGKPWTWPPLQVSSYLSKRKKSLSIHQRTRPDCSFAFDGIKIFRPCRCLL
jgi:hypothetical protein